MKKALFIFIWAFATLSASAQTASYNGMRQDLILDVRTPAEFALGHIEGAVNLPLDRLTSGIHTLKNIDTNSRILVYCRSGRRSAQASKLLKEKGFRYVQDGGGYNTLETKLKACDSHRC